MVSLPIVAATESINLADRKADLYVRAYKVKDDVLADRMIIRDLHGNAQSFVIFKVQDTIRLAKVVNALGALIGPPEAVYPVVCEELDPAPIPEEEAVRLFALYSCFTKKTVIHFLNR